jgi:hypothetical protein
VQLAARGKKPAGTAIYKLGPATHVTLIERDGKKRIAVHRATAIKTGTRHDVEIDELESGRRIAAGKPFEVDNHGNENALELRVNHWAKGMTLALGLKGGEWDKKENQRSPDSEAAYDLIAGKIVDRKPIADLFEQRKRFAVLAEGRGELTFVRALPDGSALQLWRDGKPAALDLDQPLGSYDHKTLQGSATGDRVRFGMKIDPVNPEAVARKKADPEYFDVFEQTKAETKASQRARVLVRGAGYRFGTFGARFWLLERSAGSERGGKAIAVYDIK